MNYRVLQGVSPPEESLPTGAVTSSGLPSVPRELPDAPVQRAPVRFCYDCAEFP